MKMRLANPPGQTEDAQPLRGVKINAQRKRKKMVEYKENLCDVRPGLPKIIHKNNM